MTDDKDEEQKALDAYEQKHGVRPDGFFADGVPFVVAPLNVYPPENVRANRVARK